MSYFAYAQIALVGLHQTHPADWPNYGASPPTLSIGPVATNIAKYGLGLGLNSNLEAEEFTITSVITTKPADYGSSFTFATDNGGTDSHIKWQVVELPDGFVIPSDLGGGGAFGSVGPGNLFNYTDADHTGFSLSGVRYDQSTDVAGGLTFGNLSLTTKDTVYTIADNAASAAGLNGLSTAIKNVAAAKNALENVVTNGMQLLDYGIKHSGDPTAYKTFDGMAQSFMNGASATFNDAITNLTLYPGNPTAEAIADETLRGLRLVGTVGADGTLPLSTSLILQLNVDVADTLHLNLNYTGTVSANVVIDPAGSGTYNAGGGDDVLVLTGPGPHTVVAGSGNDYAITGSGNDTFVAGSASPQFVFGAPGPSQSAQTFGDYFDGGNGTDKLVFADDISNYNAWSTGANTDKITGTGVDTTTKSIETIQFAGITVDAHSANPLIDNLFYDSHNVDVFHAGVNPNSHYQNFGWKEGRNPNSFFNTTGYLGANTDVKAAGLNPLVHYDQFGWKEGRDPSANFDTALYLMHNPDVKAAGIDPLLHYLQYGQQEGRQAYAAIGSSITHGSFDAEYYLLSNPDVAASGMDPYTHYVNYGWREGRNPDAYFDVKGYLQAYPDVAAAGVDPLFHYDNHGWKEGRDPSPWFDTYDYETRYADVASAHVDPLTHYLQHGAYESRFVYADGIFGHATPVVSL
ncbi:hypothetical protein FJ546_29260 [Mesorhizobium sp. B2-4-19]|uniref:hypothetical protein n=1 Tax=Mesorhizobium sp. B2-4-19 TaxID=2589930 RepID=UPI00112A655B|nr:hypothetical protein [Mesorhizobium sp. B2-4-19]TPK54918.1 hypothetical protein FJ546_29260 [Mesorhizobium sp. B2-4-19]